MITAQEFEQACVCQALRRAARSVSRRYETALRPVGLKAGQFSILAGLQRERAVPLGELARVLGLDRTTLTRDLQPLVRRELVASSGGEDRRVRLLELTEAGRELLRAAEPLWREAQAASRAAVPEAAWTDVRKQLDQL